MSNLPPSSGFANNTKTTYQQGHNEAVLASHTSRTVYTSAAFLLPHLQPHFHILDIGCGPGTITTGFCSFVHQGSVTGIDSSTTVIEKAAALSPPSQFPNLTFQVGDIFDTLLFPDASFDVVYTSQVLCHMPSPTAAIKEIHRLLKPGGIMACREGDAFLWDPPLPGLIMIVDVMIAKMLMLEGAHGMPFGRHLRKFADEAGFERAKMRMGMGQDVYADDEKRAFWADMWFARLEEGSEYQIMLGKAGVTKKDFEMARRDLQTWKDDEDGWHVIMQGELLAWK